MSDENQVVLNNKQLSESQFQEQKKELEKQKGVKVVEVGNGQFKTRLQE